MKPAPKYLKIAGLVSILILPAIFLLVFAKGKHEFADLPYYGEKIPTEKVVDGKKVNDTIYHTVTPFSLINQFGNKVTDKSYEGKIRIVDFFFTSCPSICPKMTRNMFRIQWKLKDEAYLDVRLISHTVDPEHDTPDRLLKYAIKTEFDSTRWQFLTGTKNELYLLGAEGYLLAAREDVLADGGFLHSEKLVLVDRKGRIRGFYDGTSSKDSDLLVDDVKLLLKQEKIAAARAAGKR